MGIFTPQLKPFFEKILISSEMVLCSAFVLLLHDCGVSLLTWHDKKWLVLSLLEKMLLIKCSSKLDSLFNVASTATYFYHGQNKILNATAVAKLLADTF